MKLLLKVKKSATLQVSQAKKASKNLCKTLIIHPKQMMSGEEMKFVFTTLKKKICFCLSSLIFCIREHQ